MDSDTDVPARIREDRITEAEARLVGSSAFRLARLRELAKAAHLGSSITLSPPQYGSSSLQLTGKDTEAVLALLIEREGLFLASYGVILEEEPK